LLAVAAELSVHTAGRLAHGGVDPTDRFAIPCDHRGYIVVGDRYGWLAGQVKLDWRRQRE